MGAKGKNQIEIPVTRRGDWRKGIVILMMLLGVIVIIYLVGRVLGIWALFPPLIYEIMPPVLLHLSASFFFFSILLIVYAVAITNLRHKPYFDGMKHVEKRHFDRALEAFERYYDAFDGHPRRERWAWLIVLSPSKFKPREVALMNQAAVHIQLGNFAEAFRCYERCLALYPDNELVISDFNLVAVVTGGEICPMPGYIPVQATRESNPKYAWWQEILPVIILLPPLFCFFVTIFFVLLLIAGRLDANIIWLSFGLTVVYGFLMAVFVRWDFTRQALPHLHRAERLYRKGEYREGIRELELQAALLEDQPWIDKWQWLILPPLRAYSYREWVLIQMAYGYVQLGEGDRLLPLYRQVLDLNPRNGIAHERINIINFFQEQDA